MLSKIMWKNRKLTHPAAGGQAVDSQMRRMLEIEPQHIHDRSGIFLGSWDEVEKVKTYFKQSA